jgi:hypothetical protein
VRNFCQQLRMTCDSSITSSESHIIHQLSNLFPTPNYILSRDRVTLDGFWSVNKYTEHLQIVTTSNYSAFATSYTLQFTLARAKSSKSSVSLPVVAWWWIGRIHHQGTTGFLFPCSPSYRLATVPQLSRHGPHRKHRSSVDVQLLLRGPRRKHNPYVICGPLPSNGRCTVAYPAIFPQQRVYIHWTLSQLLLSNENNNKNSQLRQISHSPPSIFWSQNMCCYCLQCWHCVHAIPSSWTSPNSIYAAWQMNDIYKYEFNREMLETERLARITIINIETAFK